MATNAKKKTVSKKVTKVSKNVTLTVTQAKQLQAALAKANKNYKFLDTKINAVNA